MTGVSGLQPRRSSEHALASSSLATGRWRRGAWVHYRSEPSGAAVAAARRAGSPWSEQMDRKMLRFVEKRGVRTDKTKRLQRGQKCCQRIDLRFHHLSKCTVNCLDKSEHRGVQTDQTARAWTEVYSVQVSQIPRRFASGPAGEIPPGEWMGGG